MTDQKQPDALRIAASLELCWGDSRLDAAAAELRRLHVANQELTENLEKKSIAIQRIWKERDELRAEVERADAQRNRFLDTVKELTREVESLRADAARYCWLIRHITWRGKGDGYQLVLPRITSDKLPCGDEAWEIAVFNEAIDAAMRGEA